MEANNFDGFALARFYVQSCDMSVVNAGGKIEDAVSVGAKQGPKLPMSGADPNTRLTLEED